MARRLNVETTNAPAALWWTLAARGVALELRQRRSAGAWRFVCPVDASHDATIVNGKPGLAVTCHGPRGKESPGHSLALHRRLAAQDYTSERYAADLEGPWLFLDEQPWPCRWCGCSASQVVAAFGCRERDRFPSPPDGACDHCGGPARRVGRRMLCLAHASDAGGLARGVLFTPRGAE